MYTNWMKFTLRHAAVEGEGGHSAAADDGDKGTANDTANDHDDDGEAAAATKALENEAKAMGWTPKDQFKGDPEKWRPADEFVERGKNMLPIVQAQVKRQEREIAELRQTTREFAEHNRKADERAMAKAMATLKTQRAEAVAAGDGEAFAKADEAIDKLKEQTPANDKKDDGQADDPVFKEWESRNKWMEDADMREEATALATYLRNHPKHKEKTGSDFLELLTKEVKAKFPDKFTNPRRESAASVEGSTPAPRKGGKSYADMPAEARAACDRMAKNGYTDAKKAADFKAQYVKTYFEE